MIKNSTPINRDLIWLAIFTTLPLISARIYARYATTDSGMELLYSALFGGVGGIIGFVFYYFTTKRTTAVRLAGLAILAGGLLGPLAFLTPQPAPNGRHQGTYTTCPVCGYVGYDATEKVCENCGTELSEQEMRASGVGTLQDLIVLEQSYHFIADVEGDKIALDQPAISEEGFPLDPNWRPTVSLDTVRRRALHYYEFTKKYPVKIQVIKRGQ